MKTAIRELYARATSCTAANSPVRRWARSGATDLHRRAYGCAVNDSTAQIRRRVGRGPLILGHANEAVIEAVCAAAARGTTFGAATEGEVELAAAVVDRFDSVEMVRMVSSGTEAAMSAIRLARAATGRERLVKFAGAYHGHVDGLRRSGVGPRHPSDSSQPGVPAAQAEQTVVVPETTRWRSSARSTCTSGGILCEPIRRTWD